MTFGQRLKQLMEDANITQRQLSSELCIAASTLNGYANDYREPDYLTLKTIAHYFNVSTDYLLDVPAASRLSNLFHDPDAQRLLHIYERLTPEMKLLLIEQAKLLLKFDSAPKKDSED